MKVVALVPFWEKYEINEFRLKKISGRFLLSYALEKLNSVPLINEVYVYASSDSVSKYIESDIEYTFLQRSSLLDDINVSIETIITKFIETVDADIVVLMHPTSPLLTKDSIETTLREVFENKADSSFTAVKYNKFAWFESKPINYDLGEDVPSLKDVSPVFIEQSSLYVFKTDSFSQNKHRVSGDVKITEISQLEGLEVRNKIDYELMELIINSGMVGEL